MVQEALNHTWQIPRTYFGGSFLIRYTNQSLTRSRPAQLTTLPCRQQGKARKTAKSPLQGGRSCMSRRMPMAALSRATHRPEGCQYQQFPAARQELGQEELHHVVAVAVPFLDTSITKCAPCNMALSLPPYASSAAVDAKLLTLSEKPRTFLISTSRRSDAMTAGGCQRELPASM